MTEVMTKLREYRYRAVLFINKFEAYIIPAVKFLAAMVVFCIINAKFGYMTKIAKFPLALIMALFCSFMPSNMIIIIAALLTMAHAYAISAEFALVLGVVYSIMFLLYFRFSPRDSVAAILTPICFVFKIPYVIPMSFGLVGTPASAISVGCGTVVFYVLKYMSQAADAFKESGEDDIVKRLKALLEGLLNNREMLVCALAFAMTVLVVYFIRRMSINYAWTIAMATGALADILVILVGDIMYHTHISIIGLIFGTILACILVRIIQFCVFDVDYSRTEKVQFEDDDYYYYVKAVPKIKAPELEEEDDDDDDDDDDGASAPVSALPTRRKKAAPSKPKKAANPRAKAATPSRERAASKPAPQERPAREKIREAITEDGASTEATSRERAAYEARQAEIQRRREAARKRNERLKAEQAEASANAAASSDIVQEEDNDLGLGRRMAYQRRKLEERLNNNNDGQ